MTAENSERNTLIPIERGSNQKSMTIEEKWKSINFPKEAVKV
jgi:hypothetical protein